MPTKAKPISVKKEDLPDIKESIKEEATTPRSAKESRTKKRSRQSTKEEGKYFKTHIFRTKTWQAISQT